MKSTSKLVAAAGVIGIMGFAVLPLATYGATEVVDGGTTTVKVHITEECIIGDGTGAATDTDPADLTDPITGDLELTLSLNDAEEISSYNPTGTPATTDSIEITCNVGAPAAGGVWSLTEQIDATGSLDLVGQDGSTPATHKFSPVSGTPANVGAFSNTVNEWGMKYNAVAAISGNTVTATDYHAVPATGSAASIANGVSVNGFQINQTFGAKYVSPVNEDTYSSVILYTLSTTTP